MLFRIEDVLPRLELRVGNHFVAVVVALHYSVLRRKHQIGPNHRLQILKGTNALSSAMASCSEVTSSLKSSIEFCAADADFDC